MTVLHDDAAIGMFHFEFRRRVNLKQSMLARLAVHSQIVLVMAVWIRSQSP
jgi:hypothetical protein